MHLIYLNKTTYLISPYLKQLYPEAKVLNLETLMEIKRLKFAENLSLGEDELLEFDFIILPGYLIDKIEDLLH